MSKVAFFHNALGKTDGVSLEVDKWRFCLEKTGHQVFYCAGNDDARNVFCIPELSFFHPETNKILRNATVKLTDYSEKELEAAILKQKEVIKSKVLAFIQENGIEILIPNNLMSVGYHLPALMALSEIIEETGLPAICHNHDFYFEDSGEVSPTCPTAENILDKLVPPAFPNVQNIVINRLAQAQLRARKNIEARVVPNVFDFNQPLWKEDDFNKDYRAALGIGENDIVFLQATRVMNRKGIELAIDVVGELGRPENREKLQSRPLYNGKTPGREDKIILLCAGHIEEFGATASYHNDLMKRAESAGVDLRFVGEKIKHSRSSNEGEKIYSLWDSYVHADVVTYPSLWEGWGNQLIEAIFAKLPVLLFEYPVYVSDLKNDGFDVVSLGSEISGKDKNDLALIDQNIVRDAAAKLIELLQDGNRRDAAVTRNFEIAKEKYSYEALQTIISELLAGASVK